MRIVRRSMTYGMGAAALAASLAASVARAGNDRAVFAGVDVRTDLGTHMARLAAGVQVDRTALNLVVDPYGYVEGTQHDTELSVERDLWPAGWSVLVGWRVESTRILGTHYFHEKPFVGVSAPLPTFFGGRLRARCAAELELTLLSHNRSLPEVWFWQHDHPGTATASTSRWS